MYCFPLSAIFSDPTLYQFNLVSPFLVNSRFTHISRIFIFNITVWLIIGCYVTSTLNTAICRIQLHVWILNPSSQRLLYSWKNSRLRHWLIWLFKKLWILQVAMHKATRNFSVWPCNSPLDLTLFRIYCATMNTTSPIAMRTSFEIFKE
jgi:hypothetical protein